MLQNKIYTIAMIQWRNNNDNLQIHYYLLLILKLINCSFFKQQIVNKHYDRPWVYSIFSRTYCYAGKITRYVQHMLLEINVKHILQFYLCTKSFEMVHKRIHFISLYFYNLNYGSLTKWFFQRNTFPTTIEIVCVF